MSRVDPYKNFRFLVEIDGITQAGFAECSGFGSEVEVIEYREGGEPTAVRKLPGRAKFPNIALKWGVTDSHELYEWHRAVLQGQIQRKRGVIILLDDSGTPKVRWVLLAKASSSSIETQGNGTGLITSGRRQLCSCTPRRPSSQTRPAARP